MPNKTSNYQLNQWEPEDDFLRTDFNEDNANLENALSGLQTSLTTQQTNHNSLKTTVTNLQTSLNNSKPVLGTYTGAAAYNSGTKQTITLGFKPKMVLVVRAIGYWQDDSNCYCALTYDGCSHSSGIAITSTGFTAQNINSTPYRFLNYTSVPYVYVAFR